MNLSACRSCGAEIVWVVMATGKRMPCDVKVQAMVEHDGKKLVGLLSHFATCPQSKTWRKPRTVAERAATELDGRE